MMNTQLKRAKQQQKMPRLKDKLLNHSRSARNLGKIPFRIVALDDERLHEFSSVVRCALHDVIKRSAEEGLRESNLPF